MSNSRVFEAAKAIANAIDKTDIDAEVFVDDTEVKIRCAEEVEERIYQEIVEDVCDGSSDLGMLYGVDIVTVSFWWDSPTAESVVADRWEEDEYRK